MKYIRVKSAFYGFILFCITSGQANGAELVDVRTGEHGSYTRIVLEFDATVRYFKSGYGDNLILEISPVAFNSRYNHLRLMADGERLGQLDFVADSETLKLVLYLSGKRVKNGPSQLEEPTRIVIDITNPYAPPPEKSMEKHSPRPALPAVEVPHDESEVWPEPEPALQFTPPVPGRARTRVPPVAKHPDKSEVQVLWDRLVASDLFSGLNVTVALVFIAFLGLDILLFRVLKLRKQVHRLEQTKRPAPVNHQQPANLPSFSEVLSSLDSDLVSAQPARRHSGSGRLRSDIPADYDAIDVSVRIPKEMWLGRDGERLYQRLRNRRSLPN